MTEVIVWSGFLGGVGVGLYGLFQLALTNKPLGASTGYGNCLAVKSKLPFFNTGTYATDGRWRVAFMVGILLGGTVAALTSGNGISFSMSLGSMYDSVFPEALGPRVLLLGLGGFLMGIGARMAGGCTSGHSIAGLSLLNWPSLVASAGFFAGGILVVNLLFRVIG
jgi:uncharacterized membrane protein YedE/YeeE